MSNEELSEEDKIRIAENREALGYTVKRLNEDVRRYCMTPQKARKRLTEIKVIVDKLLICTDDAERIRLFKKFRSRLLLGYSRPEQLIHWSKIANTANTVTTNNCRPGDP
jgi:hypothetical protein